MNWRTIAAAGLAGTVLFGLAAGARAEPRERHERGWHGDMHSFHDRDFARWRGGHWYQGNHHGRAGWWWIVGGVYYFYPRPIYPYPDPYVPPVYVEQPPPVVVAPAAPPQMPPPPVQQQAPAAAGTWYYCDAAKTYYPYVATCPGGWRPVPATPTPPPR